jgi:hypothetical protein
VTEIEALEAALQETKTRLAEAEAAAQEIPILREEVRGLELAVARRNGTAPTAEPAFPRPELPTTDDWVSLSRPQAILRVLANEGKAMSPADLASSLNKVGRPNDLPHYISSALNNLQKRQKVRRTGYGRWTLRRERSPKGEETED